MPGEFTSSGISLYRNDLLSTLVSCVKRKNQRKDLPCLRAKKSSMPLTSPPPPGYGVAGRSFCIGEIYRRLSLCLRVRRLLTLSMSK